jgi:RHS repeat-associated protein
MTHLRRVDTAPRRAVPHASPSTAHPRKSRPRSKALSGGHRAILFCIVLFLCLAGSLTPAAAQSVPNITAVSPTSGDVGTTVTITGSGFGSTQGSSTVTFNGTPATSVTSWGSTSIVAVVPTGATTGNVVVTVSGVPSTGATFATGSLNTARDQHTASILANGTVLFAGGTNSSGYLFSTELYNPVAGTFAATGNLNTARVDHTGTTLINGVVLVAGGTGSSGYLSSAELYSPITGTFTATGSLKTARASHTATLLTSGWVLVVGGVNSTGYLSSIEFYNPVNGTFTAYGTNTALAYHTATLLNNGMVLIVGGQNSSGYLSSAELIDPGTGAVTTTGSLHTARAYHTATLLNNGMVLIAGGQNSSGQLASAELYNPTTGTFTVTGSLSTARTYHTATTLGDGTVLIAGGYATTPGALSSTELYNPATGTFTAAGGLFVARYYDTATVLNNGTVLFGGGYASSGYLGNAEIYQANNPTVFHVTDGLWPNGYMFRRAITISHAQVSNTDQTNFPVLISGTYPDLATASYGGGVTNLRGYDIIFTSDAAGATLLPFEQETYSASMGTINYWVQIPTLSHTTDTTIYMFYGNSAVATDFSNKVGVWDSNYMSVWHMSDAAYNLEVSDSTGLDSGTSQNDTALVTTAGEIGNGFNFDGSSEYLLSRNYGAPPSSVTLEAWVQPGLSDIGGTVFSELNQEAVQGSTWFSSALEVETNNSVKACVWSSSEVCVTAGSGIAYGSWYHMVMEYNGSTHTLTGFVNGVQGGSTSVVATFPSTVYYGIGNHEVTNGGDGNMFQGAMDEIRISKIARSSDWIKTEYNSTSSPSTFYTMGAAGSANGGTAGASITSLVPASGNIETIVTISGVNFGSTQGNSTVTFFNGITATPTSWSSTSIVVPVPSGAATGNVVVNVAGTPSNGVGFTVISGLWANGYTSRRTITMNHSLVGPNTDQVNFPALLSMTYSDLKTTSNGGSVTNSNGFDIVFTLDAAGTIVLPFEQESYGATTGAITYWVQIPVLSHTTDTVIYTFYGNPSITTDQSNKAALWDSNYLTVWHMSDFGLDQVTDSTKVNNGSSQKATDLVSTTGKIGKAFSFDGSTEYIISGSYGIPPSSVTLEAWVQPTSTAGTVFSELGQGVVMTGYHSSALEVETNNSVKACVWNSSPICVVAGSGITYNNWHHVVMEYNGSTLTGFVDGVQGASTSATASNPATLFYGVGNTEGSNGGNGHMFSGAIDEVRVSQTVRSADWIKTEYNNQSNPSAFFTVSPTGSAGNTGLSISSIFPSSGGGNSSVIVSGTEFGLTQGTSTVKFNTITASVTSWSPNTILATVPGGLSGAVTVTVTVLGRPSNGVTYTVDPTPSISSLSTTSGPVATPITISGSNFGSSQGTSTVTFNGIPATVTGSNWTSGSIVTTVPNGATTGNVVVTVLGVASTGNPTFTVTGSDPVILSLSVPPEPVSGSSSVTITGSNFTSTQGSVTVGGNPATVTTWGNTSIVATLPSGAVTGSLVYVTVGTVNSNSVPLALDSVYYYFTDSLGTTRVVTDSNGTMCYDSDYLPYGHEQNYLNTCLQTYKFTGYERDAETNNDYAMARHYNSRIFRFLQPDPAGMSSVTLTNPQTWNRYSYATNNPSNLTDPTGEDDGGDGGDWGEGGGFGGFGSGGWGGCDVWCEGGSISVPTIPNWSGIPLPGPGNPNPLNFPSIGSDMCGDFVQCGNSFDNSSNSPSSGAQGSCTYLNDQGTGVESVDPNSAPSECNGTGGFYTPTPQNQLSPWPYKDPSSCSTYGQGGLLNFVCQNAGTTRYAESARGCLQSYWDPGTGTYSVTQGGRGASTRPSEAGSEVESFMYSHAACLTGALFQ